MVRKTGMTPEKYEQKILKLIKKYKAMSTNEIADRLGMGYDTALKYLQNLEKKNKIKHRKRGATRYWFC